MTAIARHDDSRTRRIAPQDVPAALQGCTLAQVERAMILATLGRCEGNRTRAAEILGISIRTLRNKIRAYAAEGVPIPPPPTLGEREG